MKKILLFSHEYPPAIGGAGSVAKNIFNTARKKNYDIDILTCSWIRSSKIPNSIKKTALWLWPIIYAPFLIFKTKKYDLIICNDGASIYCAGLYLNKSKLKKTICIVHGVEPLLAPNNKRAKAISFKKHYSTNLIENKKTIFVSNYIMSRFSKDLEVTSILHKIIINHNGVDKSLFHPVHHRANQGNEIKIVSVSRIVESKGYNRTFDALLSIKRENPDVIFKWTIVGDGNYLDKFKAKVLESNISGDVIFLGRVEQEKLPEIYSTNDIFILLTELEESFGLVYLEASSCGCYVIGSDIGGVPEAFSYIPRGTLLPLSASASEVAGAIISAHNRPNLCSIDKTARPIEDFFHELTND